MFENIMAHIDTILIIITLVGGYRLLKSDLAEIINRSHKGLKEEIKKCDEKIGATEARLTEQIKKCDEKIEATEVRLTEQIEATEERLNNRLDDMSTSIKELDKKTNEVSNKVSHIEGRLDQLFPPGVNRTAA